MRGCKLIPPGEVPAGPAPPPRPPPTPPAPPAPPSTACSFANHTEVDGAAEIGQLDVGFLDEAACCGACRAFKGCASAMLMGSGHPAPPYPTSQCRLFGSVGKRKPNHCGWPCGRVAIVPKA